MVYIRHVARTLLILFGVGLAAVPSALAQPEDAAAKALSNGQSLYKQQTAAAARAAVEEFLVAERLYESKGDATKLAETVHWIAMAYKLAGDNARALDHYERALSLRRRADDKVGEAATLHNLGSLYFDLGDKQKALETYNLALPLQISTEDNYGRAQTLQAIAQTFVSLGEKQKALNSYSLARPILRELGDLSAETNLLDRMAALYDELGDKRMAVEVYESQLDLLRPTSDKKRIATTLSRIGRLLFILGEKRVALNYYTELVPLRRELGDKSGEASALYFMGSIFSDLEQHQRAIDMYTLVLSLRRQLADKKGEAATLHNMGFAFRGEGETQKAVDAYNEALRLRREIGDQQGVGNSLHSLAAVYYELGEKQKALEYYVAEQEIWRAAGDKAHAALAAILIARTYDDIGERQKAIDFYNKVRDLYQEIGDKQGEATAVNNVASVYFNLGRRDEALKFFQQALPLYQAAKDKHGEITTINNLIALADFEPGEAIPMYARNLVLLNELGDKAGVVSTLMALARAYVAQKDFVKARDYYGKALAYYENLDDLEGQADNLFNLGVISEKLAEHQAAIEYFERSLRFDKRAGDISGEADSLDELGQIWIRLGNKPLGIFYLKQSVNRYQQLRQNIKALEKEVQSSYLTVVRDRYQILADTLIALGRISEAEQVLSMLKEEETYSFLRRDDQVAKDLLQNASLSPKERAALERYEELGDKIIALGREFSEIDERRRNYEEGKFPEQARYTELKARVADAQVAFQRFLEELKITFGQKDERVAGVDSSLQSTLKRIKATRTAVVSTIIGENRLNIIVTTASAQRAHTINISSTEINQRVADFRQALTADCVCVDPRPSGQKLYDILVKPIEGDLKAIGADTILWSLDGTFRYVPVAAIWDRDEGYLAQRFSNVVLTLASRDALGLPIVGRESWNALGVGVSQPVEGFSALAAVPDELDCIITDEQTKNVASDPKCQTGVMPGRKLLDEKFTAASFENALGRYPIVHIASHFSLNPGNDQESFLLLGGGDQRKFTVENLRNVSLADVELLVLSACNTATPGGEKANGIEIEGFGAVAQKQGAKAVMATLWPVADESTRDFMVRFYELYDRKGLTKAAALQQAQMEMLKGAIKANGPTSAARTGKVGKSSKTSAPSFEPLEGAPFAHPYYWAPFVLYGNWR